MSNIELSGDAGDTGQPQGSPLQLQSPPLVPILVAVLLSIILIHKEKQSK